MKRSFVLDDGGHGSVESLDGERVVVTTSKPAPPGSTLTARFADFGESLQVKVKSCRRDPDRDAYRVEGRTMNLSRRTREYLNQPR